jgi:peptidoglycan L-alanyl-D-glutamate endopeptidase CwlK
MNKPEPKFMRKTPARQLVIGSRTVMKVDRLAHYGRLQLISPEFKPLAMSVLNTLTDAGHFVAIASTYRTPRAQAEIFASGRTRPGPILSNATGGQSAHCRKVEGMPSADAMDIYPVLGGALTFATDDTTAQFYRDLSEICNVHGLLWGGNFTTLPADLGHVEMHRAPTDPTSQSGTRRAS